MSRNEWLEQSEQRLNRAVTDEELVHSPHSTPAKHEDISTSHFPTVLPNIRCKNIKFSWLLDKWMCLLQRKSLWIAF